MATNVKFHSVTKEGYDGIAEPNGGSLYFISDNGEIRRGRNHVTGTRVFTAKDSADKCSAVDTLELFIEGKKVGDDGVETPKRGDMLVVTHALATGKDEVSAYIYGGNGGDYSPANWKACDGNVDASKVILTDNITMAGNYTTIGNLTKGSTGGTADKFLVGSDGTTKVGTDGVSVYDLLKQMLSKTILPSAYKPTASLTVRNTSYSVEYGTVVTPTYTVSLRDGYYQFSGGNPQYAGCSATAYEVTNVEDGTKNSGNVNSITADAASKTLTVSATVSYSAAKNAAKDNLGGTASNADAIAIAAGTASASSTITVKAYRNNFWTWYPNASMLDDSAIQALDTASIRGQNHISSSDFSTIDLANSEFQQVLIFVPNTNTKALSAETKNGLPYTTAKKSYTVTVKGQGDDAGIPYAVWEIRTGSPVNGDVIKLTWK